MDKPYTHPSYLWLNSSLVAGRISQDKDIPRRLRNTVIHETPTTPRLKTHDSSSQTCICSIIKCMLNTENLDSVIFYSSEDCKTQNYGRKKAKQLHED